MARASCLLPSFSWPPLLDVLHLLADFLEFGFGFDDGLGDGGVVGLGADGIEFAENFLTEEIQGAAGRFGSVITGAAFQPTPRPYEGVTEYCQECGLCIDRCPCQAVDPTGKDNRVCKAYLDTTRIRFAPRYGCGKCQTGVPCEDGIPL